MDIQNSLDQILSENDLSTLANLQEKIKAKLEQSASSTINDNALDIDNIKSPYAFDEINKPNHISSENRELIFYIRAEVSTVDHEQNKYVSLDQCMDESYHIPVPSGSDLQTKISEFIRLFETSLGDLAKKIYYTNGQ